MADSSGALQAMLFRVLSEAHGAQGAPVFDRVPQKTPIEYIRIGEDTLADLGTKTELADDATLTVHTFTGAATRGRVRAKQLMGINYDALHNAQPAMEGFRIISCVREFQTTFSEENDAVIHGVQRFRVAVEPE